MEPTNRRALVKKLQAALLGGVGQRAARLLRDLRPEDVADLAREMTDDELGAAIEALRAEVPDFAAEVVSLLDRHDVRRVLSATPDDDVADLLEQLPEDDATYVVQLLAGDRVDAVVAAMEEPESAVLRERLGQPEDSAGRLMSSEYLALPATRTAGDAIASLQGAGEDVSIYYVYLVDEGGHLAGVVSLRRLLRVPPDRPLLELSPKPEDVVSVRVTDDQELVAQVVAMQDLVCVPVVDEHGVLVGVVTHDDVVDVLREEATEDMLQMAGTSADEVIQQSVWTSVRSRMPWLVFCLLGELVSMQVLHLSENRLGRLYITLGLFVPAIIAMGGNVGTQAATIVVRGLATGRIRRHDGIPVFWRELRTALVMASCYGALLAGLSRWLLDESASFCLVVGLGLAVCMTLAAVFGTLVPIVFHVVGVDPAVATGPLVTTAMDVVGIGAYFALAGFLLAPG